MPKTLKIEADPCLTKLQRNFLKRWNISIDDLSGYDFQGFKNRICCVLAAYIEDIHMLLFIERNLFYRLGIDGYYSQLTDFMPGFFDRSVLKRRLDQGYDENKFVDFLWCLENIIDICLTHVEINPHQDNEKERVVEQFIAGMAEALELSNINAVLCQRDEQYMFYPKGAELLDEKLVNDNLNWLEDYPDSHEKFHKALVDSLAKKSPRDIIDDVRLAFELFLKKFNGNDKSLENQKEVLGQFFKNKAVPTELSNMFDKLFNLYTLYNNKNVKHYDNCSENEVEFIIYLTGTFIRFLIQTKNK